MADFCIAMAVAVTRQVDIAPDGAFLGRGADCAVRTDDAMVSRKNCKISFGGGRWSVEDLGSSNGTFVNEVRIQKQALNHADVVRCGTLQVRFVETADAVSPGGGGGGGVKPRTMSIPAQGGGARRQRAGRPGAAAGLRRRRRRAQPRGADAAEGLRAEPGVAGARDAGGAAARGVAGARVVAASQRGQRGRAAAAARGEPVLSRPPGRDPAREVAAGRRDPRGHQGGQRAARRARVAQGRAPDEQAARRRAHRRDDRRASASSSARTRTCSAPSR